MSILSFLKRLKPSSADHSLLQREYRPEGLELRIPPRESVPSVDEFLDVFDDASAEVSVLAAYLGQLAAEGKCSLEKDRVLIPWSHVYALADDPEHSGAFPLLELPPVAALRPILACEGTLSDPSFRVYVDGWAYDGRELRDFSLDGATASFDGARTLLPDTAWHLISSIDQQFAGVGEERSRRNNELAWGCLRVLADSAEAAYRTPYLESTIVLTPETLRLPLKRVETALGRVVTVEPTFSGAPEGWLKSFDGFNSVQPHYDFSPKDGGHVRVVVSNAVRDVLQVIKREMPARRVAGAKAERFIHNPWAFLGESAEKVLREDQFEEDRAGAGPSSTVFSVVPRVRDGRIERVDLVVTEHFFGGFAATSTETFEDLRVLERFGAALEQALKDERTQFPWLEFDLTLDGDSTRQLEYSRQLTHMWRMQPAQRIEFEDVYELSDYSGRIEGIGPARPIYVPLLQKPSDDDEGKPGWLPPDLIPMVKVTLAGHEGQVIIPLSKQWVEAFERDVTAAEASGLTEVSNAGLPTRVSTADGRNLVEAFKSMLGAQETVKLETGGTKQGPRARKDTLLVKLNFAGVDYLEERRLNLALPSNAQAVLPQCLRSTVRLKTHQLNGVAWFQHLVSRAPADCRGALLADDMGLGKTLQLLTVLAWYYERNPNASASLIVAPKSLVENWRAETQRFFTPAFPEILVLYGEGLDQRRQPPGLIASELTNRGVVDLLRPGWVGKSKVVITTYEVLTRYEFSLAKEALAFLICDEAQRIKTPGTQVTITTKALKADFRIACTGTPVENNLADLWCLFDLVQPGLLGGLEEFGRTFRRPIECETEEQKATLAHLQQVIAPQTLRRTKLDIASELKRKLFGYTEADGGVVRFKERLSEKDRLAVPMSSFQTTLYLGGLKKLQDSGEESDTRKRARLSFGALHLMKAVCAEPYCLPGMKFLQDKQGPKTHLENSPKLAWLLSQLATIQSAREKAIVFTELREVQSALYYFLREEFGIKPSIINGDSQYRQGHIDRFSEKEGFNVIILSTLAAGVGLNVTAANHVIHFTRAWNPAKENQATDRAYRIGQELDVYVYCPIATSEQFITFDERLDSLLRQKAGLADATIGGSAMESMLNGTGRDVSFTELVGGGGGGVAVERRYLTMDDVDRMDGFRFEVLCKLLWSKAGFVAQLTPKRGGDGGIDVVALNGREGELLQCKSSASRQVGWDAIKEVAAGAARVQAQYARVKFRRVAVTNQSFTTGAREQALANKVVLIERHDLELMLSTHPTYNDEFEMELGDALAMAAAA